MADLTHVDLLALASEAVTLRKVSNHNGGEYAGPCPACGGRDRFRVWPSPPTNKPHYWCRQCETQGDAADFLVWTGRAATIGDALKMLDASLPLAPAAPQLTPPPSVSAPPADWQAEAAAFVAQAEAYLWTHHPDARAALGWLRARGLTNETIQRARLGYATAGPCGVTIPCYIDGALWYVKTRRPDRDLANDPDAPKYIHRPGGSAVALYNAGALTVDRPAIVVESELDALAIAQVAGDFATAVATGTATGAHRARWLMRLALPPRVYIALDNDDPGHAAAAWWLDRLAERAERITTNRKDPGDVLKLDGAPELRRWLAVEMGVCFDCGADVWRYMPDGRPVCLPCYAQVIALAAA